MGSRVTTKLVGEDGADIEICQFAPGFTWKPGERIVLNAERRFQVLSVDSDDDGSVRLVVLPV